MGCPNDCVFCNQHHISGEYNFSIEKVNIEIEKYLEYFKNKSNIELAFYGGSFTAINKDIQIELLKIAKKLKDSNKIHEVRLSTRPDCINEEVLSYLTHYGVDTIELGVQSLDQEVLEKSNRGHDAKCVYTSSELIKDFGIKLGLQQMIGLPSDNYQKSLKTALEIIKIKPDMVRIYPTLVIKNTQLEKEYLNDSYTPISLDEAVNIVSDLLILYENKNIKVIRVGLQSTDNLKYDKDVVAGPLHDALGEIAYSERLYKMIKDIYLDFKPDFIKANSRNISLLVGQRSIYKEKYIKMLKNERIKFISDNNLGEEILFGSKNKTEKFRIKELSQIKEKEIINVFEKH